MIGKIAIPYAEALLDIAQQMDLLEETSKDLSSISFILSESQDLQYLLSNPLVDVSIKKNTLKELFHNQVNDFVLNFLLVLIDRRRISYLSIIIDKYLELTYQLESITVAELYSAYEFTEIQKQNLINKIKLITKTNTVKLISSIDRSLIGGFIVRLGSKIIDTSLSGRLNQISFYLKAS